MQIITDAVVNILGVDIIYLSTVVVQYFKKKRQALINQMGNEQYNMHYNNAKSIFYAVEQEYRLIPKSGEQKAEKFNRMLMEKIPSLKQEDLDHFREAIVGEINTQIKQSKLLEPADSITNEKKQLLDSKENKIEN
ncbi:TPA: hypothetical protein PTW06_001350 [Clostridium botulinum]|nr:hypothetical protein [Clostridium botulinum]HDK7225806.1 hypothetical protein [Clostridium botulinum]HDK7271496.1 hypothetical protein [Clostridium botulinum]HDK7304850.1 hypothetical protein [Clostridium botulinum]